MQLNVEQKRIIEAKPNGHVLVKGVAGSGKTTVAVHRIPLLLNNYCHGKDDKVLMVTFNKSLTRYVEYIYDKIQKERESEQLTLIYQDNSNKLDIKTIDSLMFRYFKSNKKYSNLEITPEQDLNTIILESIIQVSKLYPKVKILSPTNLAFIKEEIKWIKACNYNELEVYQSVDRLGRISRKASDGPQKLRKNSDARESIFRVLELYNKKLRENNKIDFQDMALIALETAKKNKITKYTHILIDESQDLTKVQLEFIKELYNEKSYSSITFVADVAQSIYPQAWLTKNRSFASIGFDMKGKSTSLSKNYRTTTQIAQAAYSLIEGDEEIIEDDNFVKPSLIDKQGVYPVCKIFKNKNEEADFITKTISKELLKEYELKDIAIIARKKDQLTEMRKYLDKANIPSTMFESKDEFDFNNDSIKLVTMHSIKGLEFKVVIIIGLNGKIMPLNSIANEFEDEDVIESRDRKLLYVGMTRATELLFITSDGKPSKFIGDINYKYLRISNSSNFRRIHRIDIDKYYFKDKILDLYSEEEKVRQWMIKELIETYKYNKDLIEIEKPVSIGSKPGLVDIVVNIYKNKVKVPYIMIEVKRWGLGTERAVSQLKSYMAASSTVQYGIATDGNNIVIINKDEEEIEDIPEFKSSMMPSSLTTYEYINLKHNRRIEFICDLDSPSEIYVNNDGHEDIEEDVRKVPVFNEIAAGKPVLINDSWEGEFYLPNLWTKSMEDIFILKIKGDSMVNKNIHDGDYVLINKQPTANIGDIAAVDIDGNATLKTYKTMGGKILLIPENDAYEPMFLDEEQVKIIGVAVGVIKKSNE
ncbi:MAG: repressor LexA [Clostridiales bacterium]|nr:repressor LexA [Clostridiales bacterium]